MAVKCSDCGGPARELKPEVLAAGSTVREPGEHLCGSCSSSRTKLVRTLAQIPTALVDIKAKRAPR